MRLIAQLERQLDDPTLTAVERAKLRCQLAKEFEESGNYEAARNALGDLWRHIGERPRLDNLDQLAAAEVLLRAGTLSGWIGSARQLDGAQEIAKDLISESISIFEELREEEKACGAQIDLSVCYWREGAFDEARVLAQNVLNRISGKGSVQELRAVLDLAVIERTSNRIHECLRLLLDASPMFDASESHGLKARFHNQLGTTLKELGAAEQRSDYFDRALIEYTAASFHFEQAGNVRFRAVVENNLGFVFLLNNRFEEAHEHLDRAQRLFISLKDDGSIAQLNDTRARAFLAQGDNTEAERVARAAVRTLEPGDRLAVLAEALTTHGVALARIGQHEEARAELGRAIEVAERAGDNESAGLAAIIIIEELGARLTIDELRSLYARADELLINSSNPDTLKRLRACARRLTCVAESSPKEFHAHSFVYADERTEELLRRSYLIAGTGETILITGETGTGKEALAHLIHEWSGRAGRFVPVNCNELTETVIESRLFGHRQGSFEGAIHEQAGAVREAAGGTLFLDNIAELSTASQGKILRLIERGEIHAIGASAPERVDVRVIAAANYDLTEHLSRGLFRHDLFYRLNTFHLVTPALRERPADIPLLAKHFIQELCELHGKHISIEPPAFEAMRGLTLKGNAHELRSLMERTLLEASDETVITRTTVETVAARQSKATSFSNPWEGCSLKEEVLSFESNIVRLALETADGTVTQAARLLGITHQRLCAMLQSRHKILLLAKKAARPRNRSTTSRL
jgi:DNA-binding NtrC family response regulator/Flp pilus assembly protein TadD